jgi:hypothetical protein
MECNWQTKHCILLSYPRGGAGKVLANTLGLSQHCVLQSVDSADW